MYFKKNICPRSSDPFYIVTYYMNWVTTSWTHSICILDPDSGVTLTPSGLNKSGSGVRPKISGPDRIRNYGGSSYIFYVKKESYGSSV